MLPRRTITAASIAASLSLLVVSCGGSDDSGGETAASAPSSSVSATSEGDAETASTVEPTLAPDTSEPTATAAPAPTAPPEGGLSAACLEGEWVMGVKDTASLLGSLLPGFPIEVQGTMAMTFAGSSVEHYINMVVTFTLPEGQVSGALDQRFAGTYEIDGDVLAITNDSIEGGWSNLTGEIGGVSVDVPAPPTELPPFTGGPATCEGDVLTVQYTSGLADAVARFTRV